MTNQRSHTRSAALLSLTAAAVFALAGIAAAPSNAFAQDGRSAAPAPRSDAEILGDFMHFVRIANYDLAKSLGDELLAKKLSSVDVVKLVEASGDVQRFEESMQRAMRVRELEPIAASLSKSFEAGKLSRARSPEEITRAIEELTGTLRGRLLARQRLVAAGEYAMPQLFEAFLDRKNLSRQAEVRKVIIDLGRQSVMPLAATLSKVTPAQQEQIAELMGQVGWRHAVPFLSDLADSTKSDAVKAAATRSIDKLGGSAGLTTAELYRQLAEGFYAEKSELTSFVGEDTQLLWQFLPQSGLSMSAIRTPVFHEAISMSLTERAMKVESSVASGVNPETLALWVASNYSREIDTPAGYVNPAYPVVGAAAEGAAARRPADYFGAASGADVAQRVLARAIDTRDTQLARKALGAVQKTAGTRALATGGRTPLVEALNYPNRRVQFDAALAIAGAQPGEAFGGSERVVPTLASSIRGATSLYAVVIASETEQYQVVRKGLEKLGYTVLPQGRSLTDIAGPISEAPAVDVVVASGLSVEAAPHVLDEVRTTAKTAATPVVLMTRPESFIDVSRRYAGTAGVAVRQTGIGEDALGKTVGDLVTTASGGPISEQEARAYAIRSLASMRDLAVSGNSVLNVGDAAPTLMATLADSEGVMKMQIADILSRVNQDRAQRSLMDAALAAPAAERIAMMTLVSDSAKRYGNMLEERHVTRVLELASKGDDAEATAAASLLGALNIPNGQLVPLIVGK